MARALQPPPRVVDDPVILLSWVWELYNQIQSEVIRPLDTVQKLTDLPDDADINAIRAKVNEILRALRTGLE